MNLNKVQTITLTVIVMILVMFTACTGKDRADEDVSIETSVDSPDKEHIATIYYVSGGGAAGYVYTYVSIRDKEEKFIPYNGMVLQGSHFQNLSIKWAGSDRLVISYSQASAIFTRATEWETSRKVLIEYVNP